MARRDLLFWTVAIVIILGVLALAVPLRHTHYNHAIFWTRVVGGLVVFRVGMQGIWAGMRSRHRPRLWVGVAVAVVGLYLVYLGLVALGLYPPGQRRAVTSNAVSTTVDTSASDTRYQSPSLSIRYSPRRWPAAPCRWEESRIRNGSPASPTPTTRPRKQRAVEGAER